MVSVSFSRVPANERDFLRGHLVDAVGVKDEVKMAVLAAVHGGEEVAARSGAQDVFEQAQIDIAVELFKVVRAALADMRPLGVMAQKRLQF